MSVLHRLFDERFLDRRRRSTSLMGMAGVVVAVGLFEYRYFHDRRWDWDLLVVAVAMVVVKLVAMAWYLIRD